MKATVNTRNKRVDQTQLKILFNVPFFASGVARLPVVWDGSVPTACTDGSKIRWNPDFFDQCKDDELVSVYCEEVAHNMLGHLWRAPLGANPRTWNAACDHAIRLMMREFAEMRIKNGNADPFPLPGGDEYQPNPAYTGMAEEKIYQLLNQGGGGGPGKPPGKGKGPGGGKRGQPGGKNPPQGQPQPGQGAPGGKPEPHSMPPLGEFEMPDPAQAEQNKQDANSWKNTFIQAVAAGKGRGIIPGGVERLIEDILNPKVPWTELVRNFAREQCHDDWDWMQPDPMYDDSGFLLPSLNNTKVGTMVFAKDTSGSINRELLTQFVSEEQYCLDELRPCKLIDICCDSAIHAFEEYVPGDTISRNAPGGGGTNFTPVFEKLAKLDNPPKCLVYLTDLDGTFPDEAPPYPVLWVCWEKGKQAPFGQVIEV